MLEQFMDIMMRKMDKGPIICKGDICKPGDEFLVDDIPVIVLIEGDPVPDHVDEYWDIIWLKNKSDAVQYLGEEEGE